MALVDLKQTKKQAKKEMAAPSEYYEKYPYALQIDLNNETLERLKLSPTSFKVGQKVSMICEGEISSTSEHETTKGKPRRSVGIQIQKMQIDGGKSTKTDRANKQRDSMGGVINE